MEYGIVASITIAWYDYFLTLNDEVGPLYSSVASNVLTYELDIFVLGMSFLPSVFGLYIELYWCCRADPSHGLYPYSSL